MEVIEEDVEGHKARERIEERAEDRITSFGDKPLDEPVGSQRAACGFQD